MNNGDWTFNRYEDGIWSNDHFSAKEEAIAAGTEYAKEEGWSNLYIGQVQEIPVESPINADDIIERTAERIDDEYGGDYEPCDQFMSAISDDASKRLQQLLDEAFYKWVEERKISCPAFVIEKCERVPLPKAGEGE